MLVGEEAHLKLVFFPYRHQDQYIVQYAFLVLKTFNIQTDQQSLRTRPMTLNMSSRWYRWKELLLTWSKICWTNKAKVTGPLPWFNNSHKGYISLSYWSVNADKKGWGSVVSTLLYCGIDGNPRKNYPFWYVSPLSRFLSKARLLLFVPSLSNTWSASCSFVTIFFPYRHSTSEFPTLTF